ncbi:MAG: histidine kinase dimerization/phospho-acceptor domain-containing protein, partial [Flavobacteriaceae bacterium]
MKYSFVLFLLFMSCFAFGQTSEIDSLIIELKKVKGLEKKALIENKLASAYIKERKLQNANETANNALLKGIEIDNPTVIADAYLNIANIHYINWEGPEAIKYYQKADSVLSKNNIVNSALYKSRMNIGFLIYRTDYDSLDLIKIKGYFNESLDIALVLKDTIKQATALIKLGDLYQNKVEHDSAIFMYKKAEKLIKKDDKESLADLYWALAGVYFDLNDTVKAKNYTNKRYDLVKNSTNINERASANWVHGNLLFMAEDYQNAIKHHKLSISLYDSLEHKSFGRLAGATGRIYRSYQKLGDYKSAFNYLEKTMIYNDSGLARARNNKVEEIETKYQTKKKEQEITLLKSQNELAEQQKKNQRNLFLGGLGITTIAGLFLFILYRNRQKTNTKLKELDKLKSNFFANISHEFRTPLTLIADPINDTLNDDALSDKKRQQFTVAKQNSERLLSLVNQVLDLSKIDAGQLKLHIH